MPESKEKHLASVIYRALPYNLDNCGLTDEEISAIDIYYLNDEGELIIRTMYDGEYKVQFVKKEE